MTRPMHSNAADYVPKHVTHMDPAEGPSFIGEFGSISIDYCHMVLRVHNNCTPGGAAVVPMITNCPATPGGTLPPLKPVTMPAPIMVPAINGGAGNTSTVTVNHNAGWFPLVQVVDATSGAVLPYQVTQTNANTFSVAIPADNPAVKIIYYW